MIQNGSHTQKRNSINRRSILTLITIVATWFGIALVPSSAFAQSATDMEGVKAASAAFYSALAVIDDGEAMAKVWAHTPYVTLVGPRSKSILVGWEGQMEYWAASNKPTSSRNISVLDQQIHVNGNLAWEMGQESGPINLKNGKVIEVDIIFTNVYEKLDGRWLMVSHHVQPKPKPKL
jgi:ketosteroid isomerase-like protein